MVYKLLSTPCVAHLCHPALNHASCYAKQAFLSTFGPIRREGPFPALVGTNGIYSTSCLPWCKTTVTGRCICFRHAVKNRYTHEVFATPLASPPKNRADGHINWKEMAGGARYNGPGGTHPPEQHAMPYHIHILLHQLNSHSRLTCTELLGYNCYSSQFTSQSKNKEALVPRYSCNTDYKLRHVWK